MTNSDVFNHCFIPRPINRADYMEMISELGEDDFMIALTHARNSTSNVNFGALLFSLGERRSKHYESIL